MWVAEHVRHELRHLSVRHSRAVVEFLPMFSNLQQPVGGIEVRLGRCVVESFRMPHECSPDDVGFRELERGSHCIRMRFRSQLLLNALNSLSEPADLCGAVGADHVVLADVSGYAKSGFQSRAPQNLVRHVLDQLPRGFRDQAFGPIISVPNENGRFLKARTTTRSSGWKSQDWSRPRVALRCRRIRSMASSAGSMRLAPVAPWSRFQASSSSAVAMRREKSNGKFGKGGFDDVAVSVMDDVGFYGGSGFA